MTSMIYVLKNGYSLFFIKIQLSWVKVRILHVRVTFPSPSFLNVFLVSFSSFYLCFSLDGV